MSTATDSAPPPPAPAHCLLLLWLLLLPSNYDTLNPTKCSGGEQYADSQPRWGGFLNSSSSGSGSGSGSGSASSGGSSSSSPVTRLLAAAVDHVRAAPLPGAAAPWLALPLLPVVVWCVGW